MRDNWLSNRVFAGYDNIVDHCCYAWNKLADQPWLIMSIGLRDWAHGYLISESCWGGRPHGIACQGWVVETPTRDRPDEA